MATPGDAPAPTPSPAPTPAPGLDAEARLRHAEDLVAREHWADALAEARAVLDAEPRHARAAALAQQAEGELVLEECLRNARAALERGDRDRAMEELRRGSQVRKNDPRLLALFREAVGQ
ncbi:MAG TPA: hypothetical protein VGB87_00505 [Vicinamibacteria bacterium]